MTAKLPTYETLLLELDDQGIALVTINRPEVRNALNHTMVKDLWSALEYLQQQDNVRVLIFTGAGEKAFLGGADISELKERNRADALAKINTALFGAIENFPQPTIAAIRGFALGGGCELALACDLRVSGEGARFGQPEVALGIIPGAGGTYRLPRVVGTAKARELIFTGRIIDAQEALEIGLVNRVVSDDTVLSTAQELARDIAKNSAIAVRLAKTSMNVHARRDFDLGVSMESTIQAVLFEDEEKHSRMQAFLDRKKKRS